MSDALRVWGTVGLYLMLVVLATVYAGYHFVRGDSMQVSMVALGAVAVLGFVPMPWMA
jgi:hypothetical protein